MSYTYGEVTKCKVANGQTRNEYECRLGYQVNSQDITNNSSNITLRLEVRSISSSYKTYGYNQTSIIDGTTLSSAGFDMRSTNTWQLFGERTITIGHNADGTYSSNKSGSFTTTASSGYSLKSGSASVTVAPATIPRASQPTLSNDNINIGSTTTVYMHRVSTAFTHYVYAVWGSKRVEIGSGVVNQVDFTLPMNFCDDIPNNVSGIGTVYVDTYNGSTYIGTRSVGFVGNVPSNIVPSITSVTISEGNSTMINKNWGIFVQNKSQLRVQTSASGSYSSSITGYKITGIDNNIYNSNDFTSNILTQAGNKTITITVTDSRGRTASTTRTYSCVEYSNPTITSINAIRCLNDGTVDEEGTYLKYTFKGSVSPVSNNNTYLYKIRYKTTSNISYTDVIISNNSYSIDKENVILAGVTFSADNAYDIQFYIEDSFMATTQNTNIFTAFQLINYNVSGKAMAFGKVSEAESNDKLLEIAMLMKIFSSSSSATEGGQIQLEAPAQGGTKAGSVIGNYDGKTRIFGIPSTDETSVIGEGTPLEIDPYNEEITGGYNFVGKWNGLNTTDVLQKNIVEGLLTPGETATIQLMSNLVGFVSVNCYTHYMEVWRLYALTEANKWAWSNNLICEHNYVAGGTASISLEEGSGDNSNVYLKIVNTGSTEFQYKVSQTNLM